MTRTRSVGFPPTRMACLAPGVVAIAVAAGLAGSLSVGAQEPARDATRRAFFEPVEVPLVSVDVYVTDGDGRPVKGLSLDDFEVYEDGNPVEGLALLCRSGCESWRCRGGGV
jgi:hypothetical protein